jgi:hypothetical protein
MFARRRWTVEPIRACKPGDLWRSTLRFGDGNEIFDLHFNGNKKRRAMTCGI